DDQSWRTRCVGIHAPRATTSLRRASGKRFLLRSASVSVCSKSRRLSREKTRVLALGALVGSVVWKQRRRALLRNDEQSVGFAARIESSGCCSERVRRCVPATRRLWTRCAVAPSEEPRMKPRHNLLVLGAFFCASVVTWMSPAFHGVADADEKITL